MNTVATGLDSLGDPRLDPPPNLWVRLVVRIASWIMPPHDATTKAPAPEQLHRVLVVRPDDRVGNALLTIPLARALCEALPSAQIDLLLSSSRAQVARGLPGITVLEFDKRDGFRRPFRLLHFFRFLRALRARRYDAAIDAAHWHSFSLTSALLSRFGAPFVVGSDRGPTSLYSRRVALPAPGIQEVEAKVQLASGLGLGPLRIPPLETALGASPEALALARTAREQLGVSGLGMGPFAALNPGARKIDHRWDANKFGALANALRERHQLPSLVFWGPGEESLARAVCEASSGAALLAPPTDLDQLAAHLRAASLVVCNDTGPMHLAVACGAPVLAIFLAADGTRWGHPGPRFEGVDAQAGVPARAASGSAAPQTGKIMPDADLRAAEAAAARLLALTGSPGGASVRPPIVAEEVA